MDLKPGNFLYFELKAILASGSKEMHGPPYAPPFNYLEELKLRALPIVRDLQRSFILIYPWGMATFYLLSICPSYHPARTL